MRKFFSFLTDDDGFSPKDFLMVLFGTLFALMVLIAFLVSIFGTLSPVTIQVIQLLDGVVLAIVTGVFGLQGIKEFKKPTQQQEYSEQPSYTVDEQGGPTEPERPTKLP
jgi:hypothetical protein